MSRVLFVGIFAVTGLVAGCQQPHSGSAVAPAAHDAPQLVFRDLLQKGDYAGAIRFVEQSSAAQPEKDGVNGTLILDGWVDPNALTRPPYPLATGFESLERAAAAGRVQSATDLAAKFTTGLNHEGKNVLMPPNPALAQCWSKVGQGNEEPATCIALRKQLGVP
jgi:hypothetical protein